MLVDSVTSALSLEWYYPCFFSLEGVSCETWEETYLNGGPDGEGFDFESGNINVTLKDSYILDTDKMRLARKDLCVLHPLPRVNEISRAVDDDPRACYFRQVAYGKYMREALLMKLLEVEA